MEQLPLSRDDHGQVHLRDIGPVTICVDYEDMLGSGGQGTVYRAKVLDAGGSRLRMEVAAKIPNLSPNSRNQLHAEADMHARAWLRLNHVLRPMGFLPAHIPTGTPAMLLMEIAVPLSSFLEQAGPLGHRDFLSIKAITRIICQLLRFVVEGNINNLMHRDLKMHNVFVTQAHDLELAGLAVGDFGAAQEGFETAEGQVTYPTGVYTWHHTSPRMAAYIYEGMVANDVPRAEIELDQQLVFFNELFGWARIAFVALADRPPPHALYGPSPEDRSRVPELGFGGVLDGVRHLLRFALDLMTVGLIDDEVSSEYIQELEWYNALPGILGAYDDAN